MRLHLMRRPALSRQWEHGDGSTDVVQAYKLDENPFEKEGGGVVTPLAKALQGVKNFFGTNHAHAHWRAQTGDTETAPF